MPERVGDLEAEVLTLAQGLHELVTIVGQLTAYSDFHRGAPKSARDEMDEVLWKISRTLHAQLERFPDEIVVRMYDL